MKHFLISHTTRENDAPKSTSARRSRRNLGWGVLAFLCTATANAVENVFLTDVPDYEWHVGCFGTATGNLVGYWDRHGFPNFYSGPTAEGLAPLTSYGPNYGIRSLWASEAGLDGRPRSVPGHVDDYYVFYGSTLPDPYVAAGRAEHEPDCLGDFIGLDQNKWTNLNGECDGNIDGYSFVYWDETGERRLNFDPGPEAGLPAIDIQSGLRHWTQSRGRTADVFTQLSETHLKTPPGAGFTFSDLRSKIDAGYPVLFFLQDPTSNSLPRTGMARANPTIHAVLAYGYFVADNGAQFVRYRSSFAGGDSLFGKWAPETVWAGIAPLRGIIAYEPRPQLTRISEENGRWTIEWDGPDAELYDVTAQARSRLSWYVVEETDLLDTPEFREITEPTTDHSVTLPASEGHHSFFRLKLLSPEEIVARELNVTQ